MPKTDDAHTTIIVAIPDTKLADSEQGIAEALTQIARTDKRRVYIQSDSSKEIGGSPAKKLDGPPEERGFYNIKIDIDGKHIKKSGILEFDAINENAVIEADDIVLSKKERQRIQGFIQPQKHIEDESDSLSFFRENAATIIGGVGGTIGAGLLAAGLLLAFTPAGWGILAVAGVIAGAAVAGGLIGLAAGAIADRMASGNHGDGREGGVTENDELAERDDKNPGSSSRVVEPITLNPDDPAAEGFEPCDSDDEEDEESSDNETPKDDDPDTPSPKRYS